MIKRILLLSVFLVACCAFVSAVQAQDYKIGVLANRGAVEAFNEWKPTADMLTEKLGKQFTIVPLSFDQLTEWTKEKKVDFVLGNSALYVELNKLYGIHAIATIVNQYKTQPMDQFSSTILVKTSSPIKSIADLKGKEFGIASRSAFGGWLMTHRVLLENGVDPGRDLKELRPLKTHDNVVFAVFNGAVECGSVRSGVLEKMIQDGKIRTGDLRVVNQIQDGFPLMHSTALYPEYPMAACQQVPANVRNDVAQALINVKPTDPQAAAAKIFGWKKPLDYAPVVDCLRYIRYGAFAN